MRTLEGRIALIASTFALFCSFSLPTTPAKAETPLLTLAQANALPQPWPQLWGLEFSERFEPAEAALYKMGDQFPEHLCDGITDPRCTGQVGLYQMINLDLCTDQSVLSCIVGMWVVDSSGNRINGEIVRPILFSQKQAVAENVELNLPKNTAKGIIYRVPGVKNNFNSDQYFIASNISMFKGKAEKAFTYGEINTGIRPVREIAGDYAPSVLLPTAGTGGGNTRAPNGSECIAVEIGICFEQAEFPAGYRFGLTIRIGEKLNGWFHGRMSLPEISISDWKRGQEISIEAEPVTIPNLDFVVPPASLPAPLKKRITDCESGGCGGRGTLEGIYQTGGNLSHPNSMDLIKEFAPVYNDKATKTQSVWFFKNMFNHAGSINTGQIDRCAPRSGGLAGLVLTNALTYSSGPPSYDSESGTLVYKVASPHLEADGDVAQGTYDLSIRSEVARCIYGFSNAPIKAEISIAGDDGEKRIATTIVNEKDGWLYLTARGFTFSAPVIRVKLSQDQVKNVETQKSATATVKSKSKKVSITCTKGKITKKVVGVSPKCPKGFVKK
jgi:hypothetical protein